MLFSGFTDEAGRDLSLQIEASKRLGWSRMEIRRVGPKEFARLDEAEFEDFCCALESAGLSVHCVGSEVANWSRDSLCGDDFARDMADLDILLPRMEKLGTKLLRGMSYVADTVPDFDSPEREKEIFRKLNILVRRCEEHGIVYGHENCRNYGGQSYVHTLKLLENVKSDAFKLIFDTGNPVNTFNRIGERPYKLQDSFEFYRHVRDFVCHIHIKDAVCEFPDSERPKRRGVWAGEGSGKVREIVSGALKSGYDGVFSIEPHVATVFQAGDDVNDPELAAQRKLETYVEYGRRFEKMVSDLK